MAARRGMLGGRAAAPTGHQNLPIPGRPVSGGPSDTTPLPEESAASLFFKKHFQKLRRYLSSASLQSSSSLDSVSSTSTLGHGSRLSPNPSNILAASASTEPPSLKHVSLTDLQSKKYSAWRKAFKTLNFQDVEQFRLDECDIHDCVQKMREATERHRQACEEQSWTYTKDGEHIVLRDIADKMINWIDRFKEIGDIVIQFDPVHAALPWAGFRFLLMIATADVKNRGAILVGLETIENVVSRSVIYERLYLCDTNIESTVAGSLETALVGLYAAILVYLARSKRYYSHNAALRKAVAVGECDFASMVKDIARKEKVAHRAAEVANMEVTMNSYGAGSQERQKLMKLFNGLEIPIVRMEFELANITDDISEAKRLAALQWISTAKYGDHYRRAAEDRLDDSGRWLLERPEFQNWRENSSSSLLWLHGIPGAGKTKLVSLVVDTLIKEREAGSKQTLAYFFCDRGEPGRREAHIVLRAIIKQLSSHDPTSKLLEPIERTYDNARKYGLTSELDLNQSQELIIELLSYHTQCNIVIDALDECEKQTRLKLIAALTKIMESSSGRVKIFISSREDADISTKLRKLPGLRISATDNSEDIKRYVQSEVNKQVSDEQLLQGKISDKLKAHVIATLIGGADGMFMWAVLQIKNLCDPERFHVEADVYEELGKLPIGLKETYSTIFKKISSLPMVSKNLAIKTLKWIMCSQRPLCTTELIAAISVSSDSTILQDPNLDRDTILRFCQNLVVWDSEQDVFRFAHLSVREFLDTNHFTEDCAHTLAAETCLLLLCLPNDEIRRNNEIWVQVRKTLRPYYYEHWAHHIRSSGQISKNSSIYRLQVEFFNQSGRSNAYLEFVSEAESGALDYFHREYFGPYRVHLLTAVYFQLLDSVQFLLSCPLVDVNARSRGGTTALFVASRTGCTALVKLLLDGEADPNQGVNGTSALLEAAVSGHKDMVQLLLDQGADPNYSDYDGMTALVAATGTGDKDLIRLLLDKGADPNKVRNGRNALFQAVWRGDEDVVRLLLNRAADPNHVLNGRTVLLDAAQRGHKDVVRLLLEKGANPNRVLHGKTALLEAAGRGHKDVVQLLLDNGTDPDQVLHRSTALLYAAESGHKGVVRALLENGADINQVGSGKTALLHAARRGDEGMAQILLDNGVNPNNAPNGKSALLTAVREGHKGVVRMLLDKGADPNYVRYGMSALLDASGRGDKNMVHLLLDKGADPNHVPNGRAALLEAYGRGYKHVALLLLEKGADLNSLNTEMQNTLFKTTTRENDEPVYLPISNRADAWNER